MSKRNSAPRGAKEKKNIVFTVQEGGGLLEVTRRQLNHLPAGKVKSFLEHRQISVDGVVKTKFDYPVKPGQTITIAPTGAAKACPLPILYEDEAILAVDKPAGLLVVATDTEKTRTAYRMLREAGMDNVFVVHRLDRDTSGVLIFAKSREIRDTLQAAWDNVTREYIALCEGVFEQKQGRRVTMLTEDVNHIVYSVSDGGGKQAVTNYTVTAENETHSQLRVNIETGRKNQIRVHMKELGHPVVGDKKYGSGAGPLGRLALHASLLGIRHPVSGNYLEITAPTPAKLKLKSLKTGR